MLVTIYRHWRPTPHGPEPITTLVRRRPADRWLAVLEAPRGTVAQVQPGLPLHDRLLVPRFGGLSILARELYSLAQQGRHGLSVLLTAPPDHWELARWSNARCLEYARQGGYRSVAHY